MPWRVASDLYGTCATGCSGWGLGAAGIARSAGAEIVVKRGAHLANVELREGATPDFWAILCLGIWLGQRRQQLGA